jgi:hypothetical protein
MAEKFLLSMSEGGSERLRINSSFYEKEGVYCDLSASSLGAR